MSQNRKMPLFVNNSQIQMYGCSPAASVTDKTANNLNIFRSFSTLQDTYTNQSTTASVNDIEYNYKPDSTAGVSNLASPVFGVQKQMTSLSNDQNLMIVDSPVIAVRSRKRRLSCRSLIDSDSSDGHSDDYGGNVHRSTSSYHSEYIESPKNKEVAKSGVQRLSDLEHRHCFDLLLNHESNNAVTNSSIMQSVHKRFDKTVKGNYASGDSVKCLSQSAFDSLSGKIARESNRAKGKAIHTASNQSCVRLRKLKLCNVPRGIVLSQEDNLLLSGKHSSTVSGEAPTENSDGTLSASTGLIHLSEVGVNNGSLLQSSDLQYYSSDDLFSDNEAVESVCLSPRHYRSPDEQRDDIVHDISKPLDKTLESSVTNKQSEVPFVSYSQTEDECILIDDSDDELFANLTQNDMMIKLEDDDERHQSDDREELVSAADDDWICDDVDCVTAADSRNCVRDMQVISELCDPWISDVADVSSDELEEAYDAAMSSAQRAEACHFVSTDSVAVSYDAVTVANMRQQCTTNPCRVSLKHLRMVDIPPQIHLSQEDKRLCEPDVVRLVYESDDPDSDALPESVGSMSPCCEGNFHYTREDLHNGDNNILDMSADVHGKSEAALVSSNLTETMDSEKLACVNTFAAHRREAGSGFLETGNNSIFDELCQLPSGHGNIERFDQGTSVRDTSKLTKNVEVGGSYDERSTRRRIALENCIEVAEFYGTESVPLDSNLHQHKLTVVEGTANVDRCADINNKNSSVLPYLKKDKSRLMIIAPHRLKHRKSDARKLGDDSACKQEEWKSKSLAQSSSKKTSVQYQKISQMRDYDKQKLRRDKTCWVAGIQNCDSHDQFQGLSQFSVAKQQLVERNRQLKASGLYFCCLSVIPVIFFLNFCILNIIFAAAIFHLWHFNLQVTANI